MSENEKKEALKRKAAANAFNRGILTTEKDLSDFDLEDEVTYVLSLLNQRSVYLLESAENRELTKDIDPSLVMKPELEVVKEFDNSILLEKEKEVFGFYLSSHPTSMYKKENPYCIYLNEVDNYSELIETIDNDLEKVILINQC